MTPGPMGWYSPRPSVVWRVWRAISSMASSTVRLRERRRTFVSTRSSLFPGLSPYTCTVTATVDSSFADDIAQCIENGRSVWPLTTVQRELRHQQSPLRLHEVWMGGLDRCRLLHASSLQSFPCHGSSTTVHAYVLLRRMPLQLAPFSRFDIMNFVNSALSKAGVGLLGASQSIKANLAKQTTTVSEAYYKKSGFDFTNFVGNQLKTMPERWAVVRCRNY